MSAFVWAVGRIQRPAALRWGRDNPETLRSVVVWSRPRLQFFSEAQLVQLVFGLAVLGYFPGALWMTAHERACAGLRFPLTESNRHSVGWAYRKLWSLS